MITTCSSANCATWTRRRTSPNTPPRRIGRSATDARTTRHPGYQVSQRTRKLVEQALGWMKTIGGLRKQRHRGGALVDWIFTLTAAAYNIVRLRRLLPVTAIDVTRPAPMMTGGRGGCLN